MKPLDLSSTFAAAAIGTFLLLVIVFLYYSFTNTDEMPNLPLTLACGAVVGAGVQTGVRLTGIS